MIHPRLFVAVMPAGLSYCDRTREAHGDYVQLAFLPYRTLELRWTSASASIPKSLYDAIDADARAYQARRGEAFRVSASGQTVTLGGG